MTIVKETMLVTVNVASNANKFYHVTLNDTGMVSKRYGRVGVEGVTNTEMTGERGFNKVVEAKKKKGYQEVEIVSESSAATKVNDISDIAKKLLIGDGGNNSILANLIDRLVRMNNHDITIASGGLIKVSTNGMLTTPVGPVTENSISQAADLLNQLERLSSTSSQFAGLINDYLTKVPQKVPSKRGWHEDFFNLPGKSFAEQRELLKTLRESVVASKDRQKLAAQAEKGVEEEDLVAKYANLFRFKITALEDDSAEFQRVKALFEKGKSANHPTRGYNLKRVYVLNQGDEHNAKYEKAKKELGNVITTWHGTRAGNLLSILRTGLYVPPVNGSSIPIQGRMFGSGVYFAPSFFGAFDSKVTSRSTSVEKYTAGKVAKGGATKSLNYSSGGVWDNGQRDNNCFMFLSECVLGKQYEPTSTWDTSGDKIQRAGNHHSIYAHASKTSLRHDEIIIWDTDQISLRYLCEFEG